MPAIRGRVSGGRRMVGHFEESGPVLAFVCAADMPRLAALGTSCPDHFPRPKIRPLVVDTGAGAPDLDAVLTALPAQVEAYRGDDAAYHERCRRPGSPPMRDADPAVFLLPGIGMATFAAGRATARIAAAFYVNAIDVMRGAAAVSAYRGLPEREAFDIAHWALEEAKLLRMPRPRSMAGRIALVTGGAGGIGSATAARYLAEGACVLRADVDAGALDAAAARLADPHGADPVRAVRMDVTDEGAVARAFAACAAAFGGLDILVSNAGIASSAPVQDTTLALWDRNMAILSTGHFLAAREAFRLMLAQGIGGAVVFVASKNGLAASPGASAYCAAEASEIHLARCLALEGAPHGIRVNTVNPDAVLEGSRIWRGDWLRERADAYGRDADGLAEHDRARSLLGREVLPEDVAEAASFLASDLSSKSTGSILNVDVGKEAFTR